MSNHITIELCPEDRKRLDELICFAGLIASELKSRPAAELKIRPAEENTVNAAEEPPADILPPHGEPEPVTVAAQQYAPADILAVVQRLIAPGSTKRAQAKAIVNDYAEKISAIPADKYNEVMDRLLALEGK